MRFPGRRWAMGMVNRARARRTGSPVILGYHRVVEGGPDPFGLGIRPAHFAAHMEWLAVHATPLELGAGVRAGIDGTAPARGVAVTFDDGYAGTADAVLPVLERFAIPATIFVTTGTPGREFWWDEVTRLLCAWPAAAGPLRLTFHDRILELGSVGGSDLEARERCVVRVADVLRPAPAQDREAALAALRARAAGPGNGTPLHRSLTAGELKRLADHPLISIGAHSVTHPVLPRQSAAEQRREIRESRAALAAASRAAVTAFSYPNGRFSRETVDMVREAGYACACCSRPGAVLPGTGLFTLPRLWPEDVDGSRFGRWLRRWFHG